VSDASSRGALAAVVLLFIALRAVLFFDPALHLGWNSDAAVFGLMAKAIAAGTEWPLYFWRQSYMGVMTSYLAAAFMQIASAPAALRLAASLEVLAGIVFYWLGLRRAFGTGVANVVALWLAIGPAYLLHFSIAPIGGEQMFVLSAIIYWLAETTGLQRPRDWLVFGLLAGFGWWIHQGTIFAVAAAILVAVRRSEWWNGVREAAPPRWNIVRATLAAVLAIATLLGVLYSFGLSVPVFFWFNLILDPLIPLLLVLTLSVPRLRAAMRIERGAFARATLFVVGGLIAYSPVIIGTLRGKVPDEYGLSVPLLYPDGAVRHAITFLRSDVWLFIGAAASIVIVPFFIVAMMRRPALEMPLATIILCVAFYLFSQRAHPGSMRYIVSALPMVYAFAAREMLRLRPPLRAIPIAAAALALLVPRVGEVRDVAAGKGEYYAGLPGDFDPRPTLRAIESAHYTVCYADYWLAYKLQWVSDERVRFIPWRSFDRNRAASRALAATPGPKCHVELDGRVRGH
jgi:Dolichyl-phosphate-mannose-protein mannosyltransferase